jgi:hypothetical protein
VGCKKCEVLPFQDFALPKPHFHLIQNNRTTSVAMIKHTQTNLITSLNRTGCRRFNEVMRFISHFRATEVVLFGKLGVNEVVCEKRHCKERSDEAIRKSTTFWIASSLPLLTMTLFASDMLRDFRITLKVLNMNNPEQAAGAARGTVSPSSELRSSSTPSELRRGLLLSPNCTAFVRGYWLRRTEVSY